jgi:hypothetical protein
MSRPISAGIVIYLPPISTEKEVGSSIIYPVSKIVENMITNAKAVVKVTRLITTAIVATGGYIR